MELISIGYIHNTVDQRYGKSNPQLRTKITKFFNHFTSKYIYFDYVWLEEKLYVDARHWSRIETDLEKMLKAPIPFLKPRTIPEIVELKIINNVDAKRFVEEKNARKKREKEAIKKKVKSKFFTVIKNIKKGRDGYQKIGSFDLEFWEHDQNILLEFGWRIEDYETGEGKTTHLIVKDNLKFKNGVYADDNRFAREDSEVVSLNVAKKRFKREFMNEVDVLVGHGLSNDFKVLRRNGVRYTQRFLDTTDIGAAMMNQDNKVSLERLLEHLNIEATELHNAGNDVEYTMRAFFELGAL